MGYSKYDYRNKETSYSRNGHSQKTMHTSYGDMDIDIPRDRNGEFEPQIVKKYQKRPIEEVYAVVFMDAIHYHVRSEGRIVKRAFYIALGINMNGKRMFWACMLVRMKVRSSGFPS